MEFYIKLLDLFYNQLYHLEFSGFKMVLESKDMERINSMRKFLVKEQKTNESEWSKVEYLNAIRLIVNYKDNDLYRYKIERSLVWSYTYQFNRLNWSEKLIKAEQMIKDGRSDYSVPV